MNYQQALDYLFERLPMFHRIGAAAYKANLDNITALSELLHHPENKFKSIHIAGTNGKGSTSHMLASVFQHSGYKTGLFTSPHLKDFRERIRINGKMISEETVIQFINDYKTEFEKISPSFFEWTTALAFHIFALEKVDIAIIETGLGGRLDSTNIITPELSVITNISFDHMQLLGDTIEKIATEKAGIIKKNIPVVIGERQSECEHVFKNKSAEMQSDLFFASDNFKAEFHSFNQEKKSYTVFQNNKIIFENLSADLNGNYQQKNICTVLQTLTLLKKSFTKISTESIQNGIGNVIPTTGLMGRWQILRKNPLVIADVAHNEAGIKYAMQQLLEVGRNFTNSKSQKLKVKNDNSQFHHSAITTNKNQTSIIKPLSGNEETQPPRFHIVFGIVNDKNPDSILSLLPKEASYYFCKAAIPRALDADELLQNAKKHQLNGNSFTSVSEAYENALKNAGSDDIIYIGGSTFIVAEVL